MMKPRRIFLVALLCVAGLLAYFSVSRTPETASYDSTLVTARVKKDNLLKNSKESPFRNDKNFKNLVYFDPDSTFRITGTFEPLTSEQDFSVRLTDSTTENYTLAGTVQFTFNGTSCRLFVFRGEEGFFIPFKDATSGKATYGGGRYLDLPTNALAGNELSIDFNYAYNPYCAYTEGYACPIPPKENTLGFLVNAGEKDYH